MLALIKLRYDFKSCITKVPILLIKSLNGIGAFSSCTFWFLNCNTYSSSPSNYVKSPNPAVPICHFNRKYLFKGARFSTAINN